MTVKGKYLCVVHHMGDLCSSLQGMRKVWYIPHVTPKQRWKGYEDLSLLSLGGRELD